MGDQFALCHLQVTIRTVTIRTIKDTIYTASRCFCEETHLRKVDIVATNDTCPNCKQPVAPGTPICPHCGTHLQVQTESSSVPPGKLTRPLPEVVKQFDATATTNITIAGVLIGFYSGAIFAWKVISALVISALLYALPLCLLLTTIIFSMRVFYPDGYLTDDELTLIKKKERRLQLSSTFLAIAIGVLTISVFVYLIRGS